MSVQTQSSIPSAAEAIPLGAADAPFIREFRALLKKYGNTHRFALSLLHRHFEIKNDEILLESNDPDARSLRMDVVKRTDLPEGKFTSWQMCDTHSADHEGWLNEVKPLSFCGRACL